MKQMITANTLVEGTVVFWSGVAAPLHSEKAQSQNQDRPSPPARWVRSIEEAAVFENKEQAEEALHMAEESVVSCAVVEPYLIEITRLDTHLIPVRLRERIRALGPTVRSDPDVESAAKQDRI